MKTKELINHVAHILVVVVETWAEYHQLVLQTNQELPFEEVGIGLTPGLRCQQDASGKNLTCFDCLWCLWLSLGAFGWI